MSPTIIIFDKTGGNEYGFLFLQVFLRDEPQWPQTKNGSDKCKENQNIQTPQSAPALSMTISSQTDLVIGVKPVQIEVILLIFL